MTKPVPLARLGRRERQIMEIVYRRGEVSVAQVLADLEDPPSYSAVRGMLKWLEDKGHLVHRETGRKYVYRPTASRERVRRGALRRLVDTFFGGSAEEAMASLLDLHDGKLEPSDFDRMAKLIEKARREENR
jgi:predicted transcriptional regulator